MAGNNWSELLTIVRAQLKPYGYTGYILPFHVSKVEFLDGMIKRTALLSESNSVLIIGPRGSGKSAILECVTEKAFKDKAIKENMLFVQLDGLVHTDDNLALEDITRQLCMTELDEKPLGSFSEKLQLMLSALKGGSKASKSILFVLDNFDMFCSHKNQTLLYNLFDVAQSQQSPICVIGQSCRPDVLQVLENRVNSRFSHQKILLFDEIKLSDYVDAAQHFLKLHKFHDKRFMDQWNSAVGRVLEDQSVKKVFQHSFYCCNTLRGLKQLLQLVIQGVSADRPELTPEDFERADQLSSEDSKCLAINDLSLLELSLVIAMMHLTETYDGEPFNFEIIYNEMSKFFRRKMMWNLEKPVVMKAFEHLIDLEIVKACTDYRTNLLKRYVPFKLLLDESEIKTALSNYQNLPYQLKNWADSSLDC